MLGCFADEPAGTGGGTSSVTAAATTAEVCVDGELGCACYGNGTCNGGLECAPEAEVCILEDCDDGTLGCTCADGACLTGLACINQVCAEPPPAGTSTTSPSVDSSTGDAPTSGGSDTSTVAPVYLFATIATFIPGDATFTAGDLRDALDTACALEYEARVPSCMNTTAVFSVDETDTVAKLGMTQQLPMDNPLRGPDDTPIAASLQTALDEQMIMVPLQNAAVLPPEGISVTFWTGASTDGGVDADTCGGWADPLQPLGSAGVADIAGAGWLGQDRDCNSDRRLLCACW